MSDLTQILDQIQKGDRAAANELLPLVYAELAKQDTDAPRERLTALRYRLVAAPDLVLRWPGGIERLAATDLQTRVNAADEFARQAVAADEPLLLELFSDPAPLVREISLRALQNVVPSHLVDSNLFDFKSIAATGVPSDDGDRAFDKEDFVEPTPDDDDVPVNTLNVVQL